MRQALKQQQIKQKQQGQNIFFFFKQHYEQTHKTTQVVSHRTNSK